MSSSTKSLDPVFQGAGQRVGMEVWRIENFQPVPLPKSDYGKFYSGDSYIILQTTSRGGAYAYDIHFWIGKDSSQDEAGTAAIKSVELDAVLGGRAVQHRELQGNESDKFLSYFKPCIIPLKGGFASGFKKPEEEKFETRLYICRGKRIVRMKQVPFARSSLNHDDVFILDTEKKIYQFNGANSNIQERAKALEAVQHLKDQYHDGKCDVAIIEDGKLQADSDSGEFWVLFGGFAPIAKKVLTEDDLALETVPAKLYSINGGQLKLEDNNPSRAILENNKCYVLDCGADIFIWVGRVTQVDERKAMSKAAEDLIINQNRSKATQITQVIQGYEMQSFKSHFESWPVGSGSGAGTPGGDEARGKVAALLKQQGVDVKGASKGPVLSEEIPPLIEGSEKLEVWLISNDHLFLEENGFSGLEFEGMDPFSDRSGFLAASDIRPGFPPSDLTAPNSNLAASLSPGAKVDSLEDSEILSDILLKDIDKMLMEENIDDKFIAYPEHPALLAAEQPFYEILGEKFPSPRDQSALFSSNFSNSPNDSITNPHGSSNDRTLIENSWTYDSIDYSLLQANPILDGYSLQCSLSSRNCSGDSVNTVEGTLLGTLAVPDFLNMTQPAWQFQKGLEEARKFLPSDDQLAINLEANCFCLPLQGTEEQKAIEIQEATEKKQCNHFSRGRKNPHGKELDLEEGRNSKQSAVFSDETHRTEMFDEILLCNGDKSAKRVDELRLKLQNEVSHHKGSNGGKGQGKKNSKRDVVDLTTLLIHCAQAVAADDRRTANELLKQIRQHSSPKGNANQRTAHWFADGLEARLAGTGSQFYHCLVATRLQVTEILKAYQLCLAACPFKKISHFFSTQTILNVSEKAEKLHIIDFGIFYGFQWPCFMKRLSSRPGGPPKLKMTGIDVPTHGFRPTEVIAETGQRLADYARSFNIPFEFHAIAVNWENIKVEDLNIEKDEMVVVNCLSRLRTLMDETVVIDSPRDRVLNIIRKIKPEVFIYGIRNGTYSAPFFVTRFREALFHFSSLFDMIETNVPHEDETKQLIEKFLFGREAINVISCEGRERVERPETYKQWQVRNLRAGFTQLPLNIDILKKAKDRVKSYYHKDFVVDQDSRWLLQGWKGRTIFALSTWKPNICC